MANKIIYQGKTYILEGENELPEDFFYGDEDEKTPLTGKEQEAENEIAQADADKEEVNDLKGSLSPKIDYFYRVVEKYTSELEMRRIIRVVYEIVAKRFLNANRNGDAEEIEAWKLLIKRTPSLFITEGFDDGIMNRLVTHFKGEINTPEDAMAFIMAISRRLNELSSEEDPETRNSFDELKEDFDEHLQQIIA